MSCESAGLILWIFVIFVIFVVFKNLEVIKKVVPLQSQMKRGLQRVLTEIDAEK